MVELGNWWLKTCGSSRCPVALQLCGWTSPSWPTALCPFLLPLLALEGLSYEHVGPDSATALRLLEQFISGYPAERSSGLSLQQKEWQTRPCRRTLISESSRYSLGEPVILLIPQRSLPRERRNVKMMTQIFMVRDEDDGNKNPLNFRYSEKKFRIQK